MSVMKTIVASICLMLIQAVTTPDAGGWRGIMPLHSTCKDVKRALSVSNCTLPDSTYYLKDETVHISFATSKVPCAGSQHTNWNVPRGTVLEVQVFMKKPIPLSQFHVSESEYDKVFSDFVDEVVYNNGERGVSLTTVNGEVRSITYFPSTKDKRLRCK